jgi:putative transposase
MNVRKPNRMKGYDYSRDNLYYITICVHDRICCFGKITVGTGRDLSLPLKRQMMELNDYGKLAWKQWDWLADQYPYVVLHAFVVMPDHVHGIIEINRGNIVGTGRDLSLQYENNMKIKSLSEIIGAYKTTVSKQIHLLGYTKFAWQRSFHDRIIRDERSYIYITEYILSNPSKWNLKTNSD